MAIEKNSNQLLQKNIEMASMVMAKAQGLLSDTWATKRKTTDFMANDQVVCKGT